MRIGRTTVAVALLGGTVSAAAQTVSAPATVDTPAERGVAFSLTALCDMTTVSALSARHPDVRQFVVVASEGFSSTTATVDVAVRDGLGRWRCQAASAGSSRQYAAWLDFPLARLGAPRRAWNAQRNRPSRPRHRRPAPHRYRRRHHRQQTRRRLRRSRCA